MALGDVFLSPVGLAAVLVGVPIVLLYLIRPDPSRVELPTFRFLSAAERTAARSPIWERLSRSLLLLLQVLAILVFAVAIAAPYVPAAESETVEETVLVVDDSASMATETGSGSRFAGAIAAAREAITGRTSVVTTAGGGTVALQRGTPSDARAVLDELAVTDSPGDLRRAIGQAGALAGDGSRVVIASDFAGDDWAEAVSTLRTRGLLVSLQQFGGGGESNVGFVDRRFSGSSVTLSVQNFGSESVTRAVQLGGRSGRLSLGPGDVGTVTLPVPAGGGTAELSGTDGFRTDDRVYVAAPADPSVDVLVLTNDRNRFLTTALDVLDQVDLTVASPPTTVADGYDVIVYSNVDPDALLPGNVEAGRDLLETGGGVAVQAQPDLPRRYGELSLIEPTDLVPVLSVRRTTETDLTRGIDFQPPEEALAGDLRAGEALVELRDGSPLIATADRAGGRILYYGYIEAASTFKYNYQYPVFWKRAIFHLAGREPLSRLNHATGDTVRFEADRITGPNGPAGGPTVELLDAGFYDGSARRSASLLDARESSVGVAPLAERSGPAADVTRAEVRTVPRRLTPYVAVAVVLLLLVEIAYVRRRGDL
jgi:hypothetical protein